MSGGGSKRYREAGGCVSRRFWREVPVAVGTGNGSLHGFIDLLFEEEDAGLVVVDYKTDAIAGEEAPEAVQRYRLQGGSYALCPSRTNREARGGRWSSCICSPAASSDFPTWQGLCGRLGKRPRCCWARRPADHPSQESPSP